MATPTITPNQIIEKLRIKKKEFSEKYGVTRLALFGSFAKDTANYQSDVDVVVELKEPDIFALVHIKEELEMEFMRPVDVIPLSDQLNPYLKKRIAMDALYV